MKKADKKLVVKYEDKEVIELKPFGLAASLEPHRPVMIFKSLCEKYTAGVPLSALEGGIMISQSHQGNASSPHGLSLKALEAVGLQPVKCFFKEIRGSFLYVDVEFDGHEKITRLTSRADEALSFCMRAGALFYSSLEMIQKCKELEASHLQGYKVDALMGSIGTRENKHPYLM
ncbi:MAG: hypothetical protein KDD34_05345 [Bdellovibrionales bacterium]|nr:hypothetical protein [Bdellovibrionales bacterium]